MDMNRKLFFGYVMFMVMSLVFAASPAYATTFDLIPPTGQLQRGQDITFTINIDTEGASLTSIQSGLTYDATLLQYVSVAPGAAMTAVTADTTTYGTGKVLFTGTNAAGFNGTGVFATVVFKIIAQSSGSTEICTLWLPEPSPTLPPSISATPAPVCGSVCTSNAQCPVDMPCYIVSGQTSGFCRRAACPEMGNCVCPVPTALPRTGITDSRNTAVGAAIVLFAAAAGVFYFSQKEKYVTPHHTKTHTHKKA
jgi:hypothetical protein